MKKNGLFQACVLFLYLVGGIVGNPGSILKSGVSVAGKLNHTHSKILSKSTARNSFTDHSLGSQSHHQVGNVASML